MADPKPPPTEDGGERRWFEQPPPELAHGARRASTKDLWLRCPACEQVLYRPDLTAAGEVCTRCGHHFPLSAWGWLELLVDEGTFTRCDAHIISVDPLAFVDSKPYRRRLQQSREAVGEPDAFISGSAVIGGIPLEIGTFEFRFMGGSMGSVVGELVTRLYERALERRRPALVISASGGARMQEGALSLMQMARSCAALGRLREAGLGYISLLTHPTTGGVAASFSMLGDVILAEPNALVGFAGPRVIKQTIGEDLPEGFQTSEYLLEHGMVDRIVPRPDMRATVAALLAWMAG